MPKKPEIDEMFNAKKRLMRQEEEAMGAMTPAAAAASGSSSEGGGGMSQAQFSGYKGRGQSPTARPSEAELEARIAAKKAKTK
jgi:hypothetical protein